MMAPKFIFGSETFNRLRRVVFSMTPTPALQPLWPPSEPAPAPQPLWPGYRPNIVEAPNGDGRLDAEKRYAHVAPKYLQQAAMRASEGLPTIAAAEYNLLCNAIDVCHDEALRVHAALGLP
jgi:hypothetical protein